MGFGVLRKCAESYPTIFVPVAGSTDVPGVGVTGCVGVGAVEVLGEGEALGDSEALGEGLGEV